MCSIELPTSRTVSGGTSARNPSRTLVCDANLLAWSVSLQANYGVFDVIEAHQVVMPVVVAFVSESGYGETRFSGPSG
ncbi:hypothetical protein P3T76_012061 [Phytophthora citrophthora]|uniref:PIN domain-containing protein n=1 Tax=Phytophthora citrophthora TaxID=4793 RepID=A0AAD9G605_9STRA|nr:hypothetical protein P3T76_012061 [Phytophthora citrophthora]